MHFYHLKLDLYADNAPPHPQPQLSAPQTPHAPPPPPSTQPPQPASKSTTQAPLQTPPIAAQTARLRRVFQPFPQPPLRQDTRHSALAKTAQQSLHCPAPTTTLSSTGDASPASPFTPQHPSDYRFGPIHVACLDGSVAASAKDKTGPSKHRASKSKKMVSTVAAVTSSTAMASSTLPLTSAGDAGFQETEAAQGILRLYRDTNEITTGDIYIQSGTEEAASATTDRAPDREGAQIIHPDHGTSVCVLAVPSYMSPGDFLNFVGPVRANVSHFRIVRDSVPNRFMVLMKFRTSEATAEFYRRYNGRAFSSLEPEMCHVVYLKSIEIRTGSMPPYAFPFLNDDPFLQNHHPSAPTATSAPATAPHATGAEPSHGDAHTDLLSHQLSALSTDSAGLAELPTCPVCLERMDSSVTGLLTILCQHTFHCHCLSKWGEGSCPVCRYSQKSIRKAISRNNSDGRDGLESQPGGLTASTDGITEDQNVCALCSTTENLWICLICGHIGCGRYQEKHAYHHYYETSHLYALELETQRVWDYAGDGYVHRLIQNKADGKLVELPSAVDGTLPSQHSVQVGQEKLDAIGLEYTYLLTSQLESQRLYFDAQMAAMAAQLVEVNKEAKEWEREAAMLNKKNRELALMAEALEKEKVPMLMKEKKAAERRLEKMQERLQLLERQYEEEKEMNMGLRANQDDFKVRLQEKEAEIQELQEQVRDVMVYLDTQQKVEASPMKNELVNGTIEVVAPHAGGPSSSSPSTNHSRRKGGRK